MHIVTLGSGSDVIAAVREGLNVTAVDYSTGMYKHAWERISRYLQSERVRLEFASKDFDVAELIANQVWTLEFEADMAEEVIVVDKPAKKLENWEYVYHCLVPQLPRKKRSLWKLVIR